MKHTPGPWKVCKTFYEETYIEGKDGYYVCAFPVCYPNKKDVVMIAAAPEMKDLLWDAWQDLNALSNGDQSCDARYEATETMEKIMSLLRRIEGEEDHND